MLKLLICIPNYSLNFVWYLFLGLTSFNLFSNWSLSWVISFTFFLSFHKILFIQTKRVVGYSTFSKRVITPYSLCSLWIHGYYAWKLKCILCLVSLNEHKEENLYFSSYLHVCLIVNWLLLCIKLVVPLSKYIYMLFLLR